MRIHVRLIGVFRIDRFKEKVMNYPDGTRVEDIVAELQIPSMALGTVLINGIHAAVSDPLQEGDTLSLLPILGGG